MDTRFVEATAEVGSLELLQRRLEGCSDGGALARATEETVRLLQANGLHADETTARLLTLAAASIEKRQNIK